MPRKKTKNSKNNYFTEETERAIIDYNNSTDPTFRSEIFSSHIYYAFYKLAENIIHTYKYYYTDNEDLEDLKLRIVTMLTEEKINKFNPDYGAKAYSYFGTIVRRWLINYNKENFKNLKRRGEGVNTDTEYEEIMPFDDVNHIEIATVIDEFVEHCYNNLDDMFEKESDKVVADSILTIFKLREDLDIFKKKAIYIYIREMTDCKTNQITKVIQVLKSEFKNLKNFHIEQDRKFIR